MDLRELPQSIAIKEAATCISPIVALKMEETPSVEALFASSAEPDNFDDEVEPTDLQDLDITTHQSMSASVSVESLDSYTTGLTPSQYNASPESNRAASPNLMDDSDFLLMHNSQTPTFKRSTTAVSSAAAATLSKVNVTAFSTDVLEFDPLASAPLPKDWMINFDTPTNTSNSIAHSLESSPSKTCLLIDGLNATPKSVAKYTDRDLEKFKYQWTQSIHKEFELVQLEFIETQAERKKLLVEKEEMEKTLMSWDQAMTRMIVERENDATNHQRELDMLKAQIEKIRAEKDNIVAEADIIKDKYKQSRLDNEDLKETRSETLESSLATSEKRYEALKAHAQEKLNQANIEIHKVRTNFEKDLSFSRAKLSRADLQLSTLEKQVEVKTGENHELTKICDELVAQIENMSTRD